MIGVGPGRVQQNGTSSCAIIFTVWTHAATFVVMSLCSIDCIGKNEVNNLHFVHRMLCDTCFSSSNLQVFPFELCGINFCSDSTYQAKQTNGNVLQQQMPLRDVGMISNGNKHQCFTHADVQKKSYIF